MKISSLKDLDIGTEFLDLGTKFVIRNKDNEFAYCERISNKHPIKIPIGYRVIILK